MRNVISTIKQSIHARAFCSGVLLCLSVGSTSLSASEQQLSGVKEEIRRQNQQVSQQQKQLTALQAELQQQDKRISGFSQRIRSAQQAAQAGEKEIANLNNELKALEQQQIEQQALIQEILRHQYRQPKQQPLADLLNPDDKQTQDRMQMYASYLSLARTNALAQLAATETEFSLARHRLNQERQTHTALIADLEEKQSSLLAEQKNQQATVAKIQQQLKGSKTYLNELETNQNRLLREIAEAEERARAEELARAEEAARLAAQQVSMIGLHTNKGKLPWPVEGRVLHRFNSTQTGQLKWKGMVIASPSGTEVHAVQDGEVVFADWLRGYGLLLMVDHGKDTMTLYGYNQSLLKNVGDTVRTGETIALVGDSGGQRQSSLYFQIREKGQPINPQPWLK